MKLAFVKFAGLANGGTEKYLQSLAILYKESGHSVDYYYTNAAAITSSSWVHPDNDDRRIALLRSYGIGLKEVYVESRRHNTWVNSNFFDVFKGSYDYIVTAGNGEQENPFDQIDDIPIIHTIHGAHAYNKVNIVKSVLISRWQANLWVNNGGDSSKLVVIPPLVNVPTKFTNDFRSKHGINDDTFLVGFHQRNDKDISTTIAIKAFMSLNLPNSALFILGGSDMHKQYADGKCVIKLDETSDTDAIHCFLDSLDVYAHNRRDGEVCSACITEALYHGLPVVSHTGDGPNFGHFEQLDGCGVIANDVEDYAAMILRFYNDKTYAREAGERSRARYESTYAYDLVVSSYHKLLEGT